MVGGGIRWFSFGGIFKGGAGLGERGWYEKEYCYVIRGSYGWWVDGDAR